MAANVRRIIRRSALSNKRRGELWFAGRLTAIAVRERWNPLAVQSAGIGKQGAVH